MKSKLICATFTLLTILTVFNLAPVVKVFAQEDSDLGERIARIEGILEQMNERLNNLNHLSDGLSTRIDNLHNNINLMWVTLLAAIVGSPIIGAYFQKRWR